MFKTISNTNSQKTTPKRKYGKILNGIGNRSNQIGWFAIDEGTGLPVSGRITHVPLASGDIAVTFAYPTEEGQGQGEQGEQR